MPTHHIVLIKLKEGTTKEQIEELFQALLSLQSIASVNSVSAGENFSKRSQGYNYGFEIVTSDLDAYLNDPFHVKIRDSVIMPLVQEGGLIACDYEFPHVGGASGSSGDQQWNAKLSCADLRIDGSSISPIREGHVWRTAVSSTPVGKQAYADFVIDLNPKPDARGIEVGVVSRSDLAAAAEVGKNFLSFANSIAWSCNGPIVSPIESIKDVDFKLHKWEHDHTVGVFIDREKGLLQFFFDRKKVGPAIHSSKLTEGDYFFAVSIATDKAKVIAKWDAECPKVFLA